jgi:hypothetical protein
MNNPRRNIKPWIALACIFLAVPSLSAIGFPELLARFKAISPPFALDLFPGDNGRSDDSSISIGDFEACFLVPGRSLAGHRTGFRSLEGWGEWIRGYREFQFTQRGPDAKALSIIPLGRLNVNGFTLLAVNCHAKDIWVDVSGDSGGNCYLFSFSSTGRLIDVLPFNPPRTWSVMGSDVWPTFPTQTTLLLDPTCHQGFADSATMAFDSQKRIIAVERYSIDGIITEIGTREFGLSKEGAFVELAPRGQFLLSTVFEETEGLPGLLHVYEPTAGSKGTPLMLRWRGNSDGSSSIEAETTTGIIPGGSLTARDASGRKIAVAFTVDGGKATLTDVEGKKHELLIKYGPGKNGELTRLSGVLALGDMYDRRSQKWSYLFAPSLLSVDGESGQELFAAHSLALGTEVNGREGSAGDAIAVGILAKESKMTLGSEPILFAPGSLCYFGSKRFVRGSINQNLKVNTTSGSFTLPAGTLYREETSVVQTTIVLKPTAVVSQDCSVAVKNTKMKVPAGSTINFGSGGVESIVFSSPVSLRLGSVTASVYSAVFDVNTGRFTETILDESVPVSVGGEKVALTDRLTFDASGNIVSGILQADTELKVAGIALRFRGGYDPENPETGRVQLFGDGRLRSGFLAAPAVFQSKKSTVSLMAGDGVTFRRDGSLEASAPRTIVTFSAGGHAVSVKCESLNFDPDGSIRASDIPEELKPLAGNIRVSALLATCIDTRVRVRIAPNLKAETVGYLGKGETMGVLEKSAEAMAVEDMTNYWYRVRRLSDGLEGWSFGQYLKIEQ